MVCGCAGAAGADKSDSERRWLELDVSTEFCAAGRALPQTAMTLEALEVEHIRAVLESTNWRVRGEGGAAQRLGLKPTTLESRMARLGITRKRAS